MKISMTDTQMVIVPRVASDDATHQVNAACDTPDIDLNWTYDKWVQASPNQGKVTPEMVEAVAKDIVEDLGFHRDDTDIIDGERVALSDLYKDTATRIIKTLGLEVQGE